MATRMQQRRGTAAQWTSANPILNAGEIGYETDTNKFKIGDGVNHWANLIHFYDAATVGTLIDQYLDFEDAPDLLNTIKELANAINNDPNFLDSYVSNESLSNTLTDYATLEYVGNAITAAEPDYTALSGNGISYDVENAQLEIDTVVVQTRVAGVTDEKLGYLANVTSDIQAQINAKAASADIDELAKDAAANALLGGSHTNISVSYDDNAGTISLTGAQTYSDENAQDAVGNAVGTGLSYDDSTGAISVNTSTIQVRVANVSDTEIGYLANVTSDIQSQIDAKAPLNSPTFTGTVTLPSGTVTSTMISNGTIVNEDISASAAIDLSKLATDPLARANHTGTQTSSTISDFDTQVRTSRLDQMAAPTASVSLNSQKIISLATPTDATDAATKAYVDSVTEGLHIHASAVAATTANINLSTDVEAGDVLDGVTLVAGNRILVKNQTNAAENGIYVVQASGAATRATDFDAPAEVDGGDFIFVTGGTVNADTGWVQTSELVGTIGVDPMYWTQFSGAGTYLAGNGLTLTGNTFSINTAKTADIDSAQTLTNKTISGASNTLTVRLANDVTGTLPVANGGTGITAFGSGVADALGVNTGLSGAFVVNGGALGTPSSATLTNATGLPVGSGISGLASGIATFLGDPKSSNLASAVTDETGSGALVFATSPTLATPRVQMAMNAQTGTTYTLALTDASNRWVTVDNTSAITVTVPPSVFSVGDQIAVQQTNTGQITFAAGSGVTITSAGATIAAPKIRTRYASAVVICTGTNTFTVIGDIV